MDHKYLFCLLALFYVLCVHVVCVLDLICYCCIFAVSRSHVCFCSLFVCACVLCIKDNTSMRTLLFHETRFGVELRSCREGIELVIGHRTLTASPSFLVSRLVAALPYAGH